jgi:hypothetical protein
MPSIPPIPLPIMDENEKLSAPNRVGMYSPTVAPITIPSMIDFDINKKSEFCV